MNAHVKNKTLTIRAFMVENSLISQIARLCGQAESVSSMKTVGENQADIPSENLVFEYRK